MGLYKVDKYKFDNYYSDVYEPQLCKVDKYQLLRYSLDAKNAIKNDDKCDKTDYIIACACGAIGGLVDIFLVGTPANSVLGKWTDEQVDNAVMGFAKMLGWDPKKKNEKNVNSAIGFLEGKFKVNYDQRKSSDVSNKFNIAPKTHHMMSLGHSPDVIGLFFSILNQFTNTSSFIAGGRLITIDTENFHLYGNNFIMKIMCGIINWAGHLMSDVAGSSGSHSRGTGIVIPFYELFGVCKFGSFSTKQGVKDMAELAQAAYTHGYDARFGMTMAIPVVVTDLSIRIMWGLRQYFQFGKNIKECIPIEKHHSDLRVMLLFGQGTLCLFDAADAVIESQGCALEFFMRLNLIAWFRFAILVFKEICFKLRLMGNEHTNNTIYKNISEELIIDGNFVDDDKRKNEKVMNTFIKSSNHSEIEKCLIEVF